MHRAKVKIDRILKTANNNTRITHFMPLISFHAPLKHQKTRGFLMFSGGIERDQWHEAG